MAQSTLECGNSRSGDLHVDGHIQFRLLRMAMYAQGIEIYCAPTVDDRARTQLESR